VKRSLIILEVVMLPLLIFSVIVEKMDELLQVLKEFKCEPQAKTYANQVLPFEATIPTIYREPHEYRVLDALFYWED